MGVEVGETVVESEAEVVVEADVAEVILAVVAVAVLPRSPGVEDSVVEVAEDQDRIKNFQ